MHDTNCTNQFECHEGKRMSLIRDIRTVRAIRDNAFEIFLAILA